MHTLKLISICVLSNRLGNNQVPSLSILMFIAIFFLIQFVKLHTTIITILHAKPTNLPQPQVITMITGVRLRQPD